MVMGERKEGKRVALFVCLIHKMEIGFQLSPFFEASIRRKSGRNTKIREVDWKKRRRDCGILFEEGESEVVFLSRNLEREIVVRKERVEKPKRSFTQFYECTQVVFEEGKIEEKR